MRSSISIFKWELTNTPLDMFGIKLRAMHSSSATCQTTRLNWNDTLIVNGSGESVSLSYQTGADHTSAKWINREKMLCKRKALLACGWSTLVTSGWTHWPNTTISRNEVQITISIFFKLTLTTAWSHLRNIECLNSGRMYLILMIDYKLYIF